ncbi:hypothetical protein PIB30_048475 [Stylosanthes scabra]|uniref:Uncharacterized protein n=1 Tax=Stylosanthes scabra TaxID=79078 RepID=A0ABU6QGL3_9FABA|nr:hypothetical protein [Stylosanthes scabra]
MDLMLEGFDIQKKIDAEFYKADGTYHHQETLFRSFKYLSFDDMGCWEEWESFEFDDAPFPRLEMLRIWKCPKLRGDFPTFLPSLKELFISQCSELGCSAKSSHNMPLNNKKQTGRNSLPPSLRELYIYYCKNVEFPIMQHQQHHSLHTLGIYNNYDSLTFFAFPAFPNLIHLGIRRRENLTSLEEVLEL